VLTDRARGHLHRRHAGQELGSTATAPRQSPFAYQFIVTEAAGSLVRIEQITLDGYTDCIMEGARRCRPAACGRCRTAPTCAEYFGVDTAVAISDMRRTSNGGIEPAWTANLGNGCTETGTFSGVPQQ
jgi:hypothetical protein